MNAPDIIGIVLVRDEDIFIGPAVRNILDFCDRIIVADNHSRDDTFGILTELAEKNRKIELTRISHPEESHRLIERYAGTNTWVFGVDGDEIYDPEGLAEMKMRLKRGEFRDIWCIYGNVLNCVSIDRASGRARGYLAPPSRSMTKLYNFSLLESWTDCPERLHSGTLHFKNGVTDPPRHRLHETFSWERSCFRCLHAVFVQRSSLDTERKTSGRLNPAEIRSIRSAFARKSYVTFLARHLRSRLGSGWKHKKYRRGPLVQKPVNSFFQQRVTP